jgi:hypothetical protein
MPNTKTSQPTTFLERDEWLRAVLSSDLPHVAVRVAVRIALHLRVESGQCNPGIDKIAAGSKVSERSVYRWIALLQQAGWIAIIRSGGGWRRSNHYVLKYPDTALSGFDPENPDRAVSGFNPANPDSGDNETLTAVTISTANRVADKKRLTAKRTAVADAQASATGERERELALADPGALAEGGAREGLKDCFAELFSIWKRPPHGDEHEAAAWAAFVAGCSKGDDPDEIADAILASGRRWVAAYQHEPNMLKPLWKWLSLNTWKHQPDKGPKPKRNAGKVSLANVALAISREEDQS